jgi:glycosyltransferase involved in cell wall biosynthesis
MARNLLEGLSRRRDLELTAILLNEGKLADEIRRIGVPLTVLPETHRSFPAIVRRTREHLRRHAPDILHSHRYKENILAWLASGTGKGRRLVSTLHGLTEGSESKTEAANRIVRTVNDRILARRFDRMVAVSGNIRRVLVRKGFQEDKVRVIHNGIEMPLARPAGSGREEFVIGSLGRLFPVKDYPLMAEIASRVARREPRIRFELAGDGPERGRILERVRQHRLEEKFLLRGFLEDPCDFYRGLDLYLVTSRHEGIPISVLEAMGHGLPVVAPRVGGLEEIVTDGSQGCLVDGRDPEAYAERCLWLFKDAELRRRMGAAARKRVEDAFTVGRMTEQYHRLYLEMA